MKKLIFASAALCAAATISAQEVVEAQPQPQTQVEEAPVSTAKNFKPGSERFGAEAGLSLGGGFGLNGGNLNFNFTLSDEWMVRLGFGVTVDKYSSKEEDDKGHDTNSSFNVKPGIIYSFSGTDRLEPYVGAELVFGLTSTCNYRYSKIDGAVYETEDKTRTSNFGANAVTGFNFYVAKDLYVGAEVGLGFLVTPKSHKSGTDAEGKEYDSKDEKLKYHTTYISPICTPSVRVGWKF